MDGCEDRSRGETPEVKGDCCCGWMDGRMKKDEEVVEERG